MVRFLLPLLMLSACAGDLGPAWEGPPQQLPTTMAGEDEDEDR